MAYALFITPTARSQLKRLPEKEAKKIRRKLEGLCIDPFASGFDIKKLHGCEGYRLRVGNYRVIYELERHRLVLRVIGVGHRQGIY